MLKKTPRIIRIDGNNDEPFYKNRVIRNSCFLGVDVEQQIRSQEMLANSVVGVAGAGGLGSYLAVQLARVGVRHIKIADPDHFEASNINRQNEADLRTIDVIYHNGTDEDAAAPPSAEYILNRSRLEAYDFRGMVMHSLPRKEELAACIDDSPYNLYFRQMTNAQFVFQSVFRMLSDERVHA